MYRFYDMIFPFILRTLTTRITPLAYLLAAIGIVRGLGYTVFQNAKGVSTSVIAQISPLIPLTVWGAIILVASSVLMYGLVRKQVWPIMIGGMGMFTTYVFSAIAYLSEGYILYLFPTSVFYALAYGYFVIAAPIGRLWDYTPSRG